MSLGIPRRRSASPTVSASSPDAVTAATSRAVEARKVAEAAQSVLATVEAERAAAVASGDRQALTKIRSRLLEAQDEADIAQAGLASAEAAERDAIAEAKISQRRAQREAIEEESARIGTWLRERYPALAEEIVEGLKQIVELELRIFEFNSARAKGEAELAGFEVALRPGLHGLADTVVLPALTGAVCLWPDRSVDPHWAR
ncbi:hypothetical protein [Methylorubrum populi]|uniref:hypothetical protein n=1 Tax=Methylorubrum populi TaxID=223967 RepID=UPI003F65A06C